MNLKKNLNVCQKFTLTKAEEDAFVLQEKNRETFQTSKNAKSYFDTVSSFCKGLGFVLDSNTRLWFDVSDYSIKMIFAIKGFEGKIGDTVANEIAGALNARKTDPATDIEDALRRLFGN